MTTDLEFYHYVWALLPLALFLLTLWSFSKKSLGFYGKEDTEFYLKQATFALVAFFFALFIDKYLYDPITDKIPLEELKSSVVRLMCYPLALVLLAYAGKLRSK